MTLEEIKKFRHTVKLYDKTKKINDKDFDEIVSFIQSAPSSFNFQLTRLITVEQSSSLMSKLVEEKYSMFNSGLISNTNKVMFFVVPSKEKRLSYDDKLVIDGTKYAAFQRSGKSIEEITDAEALEISEGLVGKMESLGIDSVGDWAAKQAYISLGYATIAAATMGIDTTAMEGFDFPETKKLFISEGLMKEDEDVVVALAFGYRIDDNSFNKSERKSTEWFSTKVK